MRLLRVEAGADARVLEADRPEPRRLRPARLEPDRPEDAPDREEAPRLFDEAEACNETGGAERHVGILSRRRQPASIDDGSLCASPYVDLMALHNPFDVAAAAALAGTQGSEVARV